MNSTPSVHQLFPRSPVVLDKSEEQELVTACLDGDRHAMETLVRHYEKPVYNVAFRMLGNSQDAADATQTTFLKVFQKLRQFNPKYKFFSWIYRIAMNESIDMLKLRTRSEPLVDECIADTPGPGATADTAEAMMQLRRAIAELSDDYREVIAMRYFAQTSYSQMADVLDVAEKTVKSRLYTARQNLREILLRQGRSHP